MRKLAALSMTMALLGVLPAAVACSSQLSDWSADAAQAPPAEGGADASGAIIDASRPIVDSTQSSADGSGGEAGACSSDFVPPAPLPPLPNRLTDALNQRVTTLVAGLSPSEQAAQLENQAPAVSSVSLAAYQYWNEAAHGIVASVPTTSFPVGIAMGATWDTNLIGQIGTVVSDEARVLNRTTGHPLHFFTPTINELRDPRWGRNEESYSEDPYLMGSLAAAFIRGMQGDDPVYLKVVTTAKHYLANDCEADRLSGSSNFDDRNLYEYYTPQFRAAVEQGGTFAIMAALNAINGVPAACDPLTETQLLRTDWGFQGYVVSDCDGVQNIQLTHMYAPTPVQAAADAINAGTDLECSHGDDYYANYLGDAVSQNLTTATTVQQAAFRVLRTRFLTGEFDDPSSVPYSAIDPSTLDSTAHHDLARKAEEEAIVLLKNDENTLPLGGTVSSIAVVGPFGNMLYLGEAGYTGLTSYTVSVLRGLQSKYPAANVTFDSGVGLDGASLPSGAMQSAVQHAQAADVVVACVGTDGTIASEGNDSADIGLPWGQEGLIQAVYAVNPKTIVVQFSGRGTSIPWTKANVPAVLQAWFGGQEEGNAVANVLSGDVNPAGRLPQTFYASVSQLAPMLDYNIRGDDDAGIGRTYMYYDETSATGPVLWPFGHGLSYTTFEYSNIATCVSDPKTLLVHATVKNTGSADGDEIVQLYLEDHSTTAKRPFKTLQGFKRLAIAASQAADVTFSVSFDGLGRWDSTQSKYVVDPGAVDVYVGASSADIRGHLMVETDGTRFDP